MYTYQFSYLKKTDIEIAIKRMLATIFLDWNMMVGWVFT